MENLRRRDFTIGAAMGAFAVPFCLSQPNRPDFSGRWELDSARSVMPGPAPNDLVEIIEHRDPMLKIQAITSHRFPDEQLAVTLALTTIPELSVTTDSAEATQPWGPGEVRLRSRWDG